MSLGNRALLLLCHSLVASLLSSSLYAAFEFKGVGWSAASGNIKVVGDLQLERFLENPSLLSSETLPQFGFQYHYPFSGLDLQASSLLATANLWKQPVVTRIAYFGDEIYSESMVHLGSSWSLDSTFRIGASGGYYRVGLDGFEPQSTFTLSTSLYFELYDNIHIGSSLQNVLQLKKSFQIPQKFIIGIEYDSSPFLLMSGFEKEAALPAEFSFGIIGTAWERLQIAFGYRELSGAISAGWRLKLSNYVAHYTWIYHPDLPTSHGLGMELHPW